MRRNPAYRADYQQFIAIWHALEADYGGRPIGIFSAGNRTHAPMARCLVPGACDSDLSDAASDFCIGDDERVLLECWMSAKWGFHKFPLGPDHAYPPTPDEHSWRALPAQVESDIDAPYRLNIAFDLSLPLPQQLDAARFRLASCVAELRRAGCPVPHTVDNQRAHWRELLQVLDERLPEFAQQARLIGEARRMVETGYLEILRLAE